MSIISDALAQAKIQTPTQNTKTSNAKSRNQLTLGLWALIFIVGILAFYLFNKERFNEEYNLPPNPEMSHNLIGDNGGLGNAQIAIESGAINASMTSNHYAINQSEFILQGIVEGVDGFHAILNNDIVSEGERLTTGTIVSITSTSLVIETPAGIKTLNFTNPTK